MGRAGGAHMGQRSRTSRAGGGRMRGRRGVGRGLWVVLGMLWVLAPGAQAQNRDVAFDAVRGQPTGLPDLPPQGAWGEVINATSRWIVIQNHQGQQFPIAVDDIQEFLIRWPYSANE